MPPSDCFLPRIDRDHLSAVTRGTSNSFQIQASAEAVIPMEELSVEV